MANILQYTQRTSARDNGQIARAAPLQVDQSNPLAGLSEALDVMANNARKREEEAGRAWAVEAVSNARLQWTSRLMDSQANADLGAPDFTQNFVSEFDAYATESLKNAPTPSAEKHLRERLAEIRTSLGERAITFEAGARIDYRDTKFSAAIGNVQKLMNADPGQFEVGLAELLSVIDTSELPPAKRASMRQKAIDDVAEAAVWSQINRSPEQFLSSIGTGADGKAALNGVTGNKPFDILSFEKRASMLSRAISAKNTRDAEIEREAKESSKKLGDDYMKEIVLRASGGGEQRLTKQYIEEARDFLSPAEYKSALVMLRTGGLTSEGGSAKSDPGVFRDLQALVYEDPEAAKRQALVHHSNGMLSNSDLSSIMTRADSSDRRVGPKSVYERTRAYITNSLDPGPMVQDPVGRGRMAEALREFDVWVQSGPNGKRTDEEIDLRGKEIIKQWRFINLQETAAGLPQPRFGSINRAVSDYESHMQAVGAAWVKTKKAYAEGKMSKQEYMDEASRINAWFKLAPPKNAPKDKR